MVWIFKNVCQFESKRKTKEALKKYLTSSLPFYQFLPVLKVYYTLLPLFIYYILYYIPLINWRWKKACLTAYFTVNLSILSCVSHNFIFGTQLSSSSTPSCMWLTSCMCIWFVLLLSFQTKPAFCLCYSISPITTSIMSFLDTI